MLSTTRMATTSSNDRVKEGGYIAFFDLDRTIISAVSGRALALGAWKAGLMSPSGLFKALLLSLAWSLKVMDPVETIHRMTGWVKGIRESDFEDLCRKVFNEKLLPSVHRDVTDEIIMHRANGGRLVILSSSLKQICGLFVEHLGMDDALCSELGAEDGILTGRSAGMLCFGPEKLERMKKYCEINNNTPAMAWYYADSWSDVPVLEAVGYPVCINPDKKLLRKALTNNWKVHNWT
jgi:HAD superfamily hydrolase (TIGR01490 family)